MDSKVGYSKYDIIKDADSIYNLKCIEGCLIFIRKSGTNSLYVFNYMNHTYSSESCTVDDFEFIDKDEFYKQIKQIKQILDKL